MRGLAIRWLATTFSVLIAAFLLDGIHIRGFVSAALAAGMLGFLNAVFRPILLILTLPINLLSLGLFTFVINAMMLKMASAVIPGFEVHGFWTSLFGALLISIVSFALTSAVGGHGTVEDIRPRTDVIDLKKDDDDRWG
ncbi:MAG: phage holin family protein [Desulfobacterales bacterium]